MLEKIRETSILYDFYGELLPEKQREVFRLYHEDNYSLSEIGDYLGITRQGVHEAFKRAEEKLLDYEHKLGLAKKFQETETALTFIDQTIQELIDIYGEDQRLNKRLEEIKSIIVRLIE